MLGSPSRAAWWGGVRARPRVVDDQLLGHAVMVGAVASWGGGSGVGLVATMFMYMESPRISALTSTLVVWATTFGSRLAGVVVQIIHAATLLAGDACFTLRHPRATLTIHAEVRAATTAQRPQRPCAHWRRRAAFGAAGAAVVIGGAWLAIPTVTGELHARSQAELRAELTTAFATTPLITTTTPLILTTTTPTADRATVVMPTTTVVPVPTPAPVDDAELPAAKYEDNNEGAKVPVVVTAPGSNAYARLRIGRIGVDEVIIEPTSANARRAGPSSADLRLGVAHYPSSAPLGAAGNAALAGHRTTWGAPFADLDHLRPGDTIITDTLSGSFTYVVNALPFVVDDEDWTVVANTPGVATLTLTTCHPRGSSRQRLIITATLT